MNLQDLIKRIEAADGPDRELDAEIAVQVKPWREMCNLGVEIPPYTSSIDAAMTLVPDGWIIKEYTASRFVPHTFVVSEGVGIGGVVGYSDHSMVLALCAAALRAREYQ